MVNSSRCPAMVSMPSEPVCGTLNVSLAIPSCVHAVERGLSGVAIDVVTMRSR